MIRRPPRSTQSRSSAASDVYKRQLLRGFEMHEKHGVVDRFSRVSHLDGHTDLDVLELAVVPQLMGEERVRTVQPHHGQYVRDIHLHEGRDEVGGGVALEGPLARQLLPARDAEAVRAEGPGNGPDFSAAPALGGEELFIGEFYEELGVLAEYVLVGKGHLPFDAHYLPEVRPGVALRAVSYTHLRAHETRHDLVCRLLLEKKKKK